MCAEDNAFLPSAHGSDELYDLYAYVSQTGYIAADGSILIGLTCFGSTKECYWDDVSPYDYGLFERRQIPNGISCVEMLNSELGWSYKFGSCNEMKTAFACSLPINKESMLACPDDFDPVEDRCLRYFPILSTHSDAEKSCQQQHSETHLASIHSKKRVQELQKELDGAWTNIHIGLQKEAGSGYEWSDGSKLDFKNWRSGKRKSADFDHLCLGFPNVKSGDCVQMETNPTAKGEWSNIPCSLKLSYFCELPASVKPTKSPLDFPPTSGDNDCPSNNKFKNSGYVTSPGYPAITTGNICDYFLSSPEGTVVSLKFLDFSMCYPQYAMIYDGWDTSDSSKLLADGHFQGVQVLREQNGHPLRLSQ
ncbi:hypothetical protein L596_014117 [Steinernema carpocapsae]|uniref:C-type lectin domain-containing protein n=1 Tax=Steinernema carpocapsae TaxID=34508 RepID=A0A4U5NAP0_STECR|nr:hypothetical protein L596_014117 [Steinernema carpocapsae]